MRGPIVVGTDASETSRLAIVEAAALAQHSGREVVVVFVRQPQVTASLYAVGVIPLVKENLDFEETVAHAQSVTILEPLGISWSFEVRVGQPAHELMDAADRHGAEMIVVAGRRRGTLSTLAHPSVAAQLVHRWPHSLLIVRPPERTSTVLPNQPTTKP